MKLVQTMIFILLAFSLVPDSYAVIRKTVKVSKNDTSPGYLCGQKITAGVGIQLIENNDGGNETCEIRSVTSGGQAAAVSLDLGSNGVLDSNGISEIDVVAPGTIATEPEEDVLRLDFTNVLETEDINSQSKLEAISGTTFLGTSNLDSLDELDALVGVDLVDTTQINSISKLQGIVGSNILDSTEVNTLEKIEALAGGISLVETSDINSLAKLEAIVGTSLSTGGGASAFSELTGNLALTQLPAITSANANQILKANGAGDAWLLSADATYEGPDFLVETNVPAVTDNMVADQLYEFVIHNLSGSVPTQLVSTDFSILGQNPNPASFTTTGTSLRTDGPTSYSMSWSAASVTAISDNVVVLSSSGTDITVSIGGTTYRAQLSIASGGSGLTSVDISDNTNLVAGRSLTLVDDTINADAELYTVGHNVALQSPTDADDGLIQIQLVSDYTIASVTCTTDTGTVTIALDERDSATPNTAGTDLLSTPLVCDDNSAVTSTFAVSSVDAGELISVDIDAVTGTPGVVRLHLRGSFDD